MQPSLKVPAVNASESPQGYHVDHKHLLQELNSMPTSHTSRSTHFTGSLHLVCGEEKADHVMHRPLEYVHLHIEAAGGYSAEFDVAAASKLTSPSDTNACGRTAAVELSRHRSKPGRARRPKAPRPGTGREQGATKSLR